MPSSLVCHHLTFAWPSGDIVFDDLSATFPDGLTGLVGRNGVGKTTLLKILTGELAPTAGSVQGADSVGYLPQGLVLELDRTVADVLGVEPLLAAMHRITAGEGSADDLDLVADDWDLEERIATALTDFGFGGLDLTRPIGSLSGGEVVLLALAALLLARPDVLILDEPTNNLDQVARARLSTALQRWRGPVIVVSHDRELLDLCEYVAELRAGSLRIFGGTFTEFSEALEIEQEAARRAVRDAQSNLKKQQRELAEMRIALDRRQRYAKSQESGTPKIMINHFKNSAQKSAGKLKDSHELEVAKAKEQLESAELLVRDDDLIRIDLSRTAVPASRDIAILDEVTLRHGKTVSLHLRGPERVGLVGRNGSGKTTLIDTLRGAVAPLAGEVQLKVPFRLLPQRLQVLDDSESVLSGVARLAPSADTNTLRSHLARFLLGAELIQRPVGSLSGGERFRANLAGLLLSEPPPQLLILDEPTNNLDLDSIAQLTSALQAYRGALLVASHDQQFLADLDLDRVIDLD